MRHFRPSLNYFGITEQQWRVLRALTTVENIEVMELAEATFLLPPSLSRILKELDKRDLIKRRTSSKDMRRGIVSISDKGRQLIESAGAQSEAIYSEITRLYGAEKLATLQTMLRELEAVLSQPVTAGALSTSEPDE
jgi:homoprotocatechuate degradation regulator HpaR